MSLTHNFFSVVIFIVKTEYDPGTDNDFVISPLSTNLCIFGTFFIFGQMSLFVRSKRLKQLYSIETSRNERLPNNLSLWKLTKKVMVQKPKIFYFFFEKTDIFGRKWKKCQRWTNWRSRVRVQNFCLVRSHIRFLWKKYPRKKVMCERHLWIVLEFWNFVNYWDFKWQFDFGNFG